LQAHQAIVKYLFENRSKGTFQTVVMICVILVIFASIAILNVETLPESNIKNASDALWWSMVTVTTVGYGDKVPVTLPGRIIGVVLMITGVGLFGTFTAFVASLFMETEQKEVERHEDRILAELGEIRKRLDRLEGPAQRGSETS